MEENKNPVIQAEQVIIQQAGENKPKKAKSKKKLLIIAAVIIAVIFIGNIISGMSPASKTEKAIDKIGVITLNSEEANYAVWGNKNIITDMYFSLIHKNKVVVCNKVFTYMNIVSVINIDR